MLELKAIILPAWRLLPADARTRLRKALVKAGALLVTGAMTVIEPFVKVRFAMMIYKRIGHLTCNTDIFLRRLKIDGHPARTHFIFIAADTPNVANHDVVALWKRHINVLDRGFLSRFFRFVWPEFSKSRFVVRLTCTSEEYREFVLADSVVHLNAADERRGEAGLRKMGVPEGQWFACFYNRDVRYLTQVYGERSRYTSFHNFRDSDIQNFVPAAHLITEQGGYAIRMGALVQDRLDDIGDPRIIDYASRYRSEFMDVYLSAKCKFFLGDTAGLAQVPLLFDRPIAYTNSIPLWTLNPGRSSLTIPKLYRKAGEDRLMSFGELEALGAFDAKSRPAWTRAGTVTATSIS